MIRLSKTEARKILLRAQFPGGVAKGKNGTLQVIDRLGYLQIDSIHIVERAHHQALYARQRGYDPEFLHRLQAADRAICEVWTHAASFVPMKDLRFYWPRLGIYSDHRYNAVWLRENRKLAQAVLERIREEGPLSSSEFDTKRKKRSSGWWDWKPDKHALERLLSAGKLMVRERRKFQRVYDIPERVLPEGIDLGKPTEEEATRFAVRRLFGSRGIVNRKTIKWSEHKKHALNDAIDAAIRTGELEEAEIAGLPNERYLVARDCLTGRTIGRDRVRILSPFDNLILDRQATRALFDFEYSLECYLPAPKRKWGYYCMPLLWNGSLVGRIDPKADRHNETLIVRGLWLEPKVRLTDSLVEALREALDDYATFNGCQAVRIDGCEPKTLRKTLAK
jgi:uncharacterized protein YcaQ